MRKQNKKHKSISFQKVLNNYESKKQMTKTIYPNQSYSKINKNFTLNQRNNKKKLIQTFQNSSQFLQSQKYFGKLPQVFKTVQNQRFHSLQHLAQNVGKRKDFHTNNKVIQLRQAKPSQKCIKINRRKLKEMSQSTTAHTIFNEKNYKTLEFNQEQIKVNEQQTKNTNIYHISERQIKSSNDFSFRKGHFRIKTQKYDQLNLKDFIYDDKQLTMSQKKCLNTFQKNIYNMDQTEASKHAYYKKSGKQGSNMLRFKIYKEKYRGIKRQKQQQNNLANMSKQEQKITQGWLINESNSSFF